MKPCEGCGLAVMRHVGKVCPDCRTLLDDAIKARTFHAAHDDMKAYGLMGMTGNIIYHWNQQFYGGFHFLVEPDRDVQKNLDMAFYGLVQALGKPAVGIKRDQRDGMLITSKRGSKVQSGHDVVLLFSSGQQQAFNTLFEAIMDALESTYQSGLEKGANLLYSLASGKVTVEEYNKLCARSR